MALTSGQVKPTITPLDVSRFATYDIKPVLGTVVAKITEPGTWTLPAIDMFVDGATLTVLNLTAFAIHLDGNGALIQVGSAAGEPSVTLGAGMEMQLITAEGEWVTATQAGGGGGTVTNAPGGGAQLVVAGDPTLVRTINGSSTVQVATAANSVTLTAQAVNSAGTGALMVDGGGAVKTISGDGTSVFATSGASNVSLSAKAVSSGGTGASLVDGSGLVKTVNGSSTVTVTTAASAITLSAQAISSAGTGAALVNGSGQVKTVSGSATVTVTTAADNISLSAVAVGASGSGFSMVNTSGAVKTLAGSTSVSMASSANNVTLTALAVTSAGTGAALVNGSGLVKTVSGSSTVAVATAADNITLSASAASSAGTGASMVNGSGLVKTLAAGTNVSLDTTDPNNITVSATGGASSAPGTGASLINGGSQVKTVSGDGTSVVVDASDPNNLLLSSLAVSSPGTGASLINGSGQVKTVSAGAGVTLTPAADDLNIASGVTTGGAGDATWVVTDGQPALKTATAGYGIAFTDIGTDITLYQVQPADFQYNTFDGVPINTSIPESVVSSYNTISANMTMTTAADRDNETKRITVADGAATPVWITTTRGTFPVGCGFPLSALLAYQNGEWQDKTGLAWFPTGLQQLLSSIAGATRAAMDTGANRLAIGNYTSVGYETAVGYVQTYTRSGTTWTIEANPLDVEGAIGDAYVGYSLAFSADGNTLVVGGPQDNGFVGAAWVFFYSAGTWFQLAKLVWDSAVAGDRQGESVAISSQGDKVYVGASGRNTGVGCVFVWANIADTWTQVAELVPNDANGAAGFGSSVSVSNSGLVLGVGGPHDNTDVGAAWVFQANISIDFFTWGQVGTKLTSINSGPSDLQGYSVSMSGDGATLVAGAPNGAAGFGFAAVYERSGLGTYPQTAYLAYPNGAIGQFGTVVFAAKSGRTIFVGTGPDGFGAAFLVVFVRTTTNAWQMNTYRFTTALVGFCTGLAASGDGRSLVMTTDANQGVFA